MKSTAFNFDIGKDKKQCWSTMKSYREIAEKAREQE